MDDNDLYVHCQNLNKLVSYFFIHNDTRIMIIFTIVLGTLVIWAHRKNIERLLKGTENRMNLFAKKS